MTNETELSRLQLLATKNGLPALRGSEKQVPWALAIRHDILTAVSQFFAINADGRGKAFAKRYFAFLRGKTQAAFWIDQRNNRVSDPQKSLALFNIYRKEIRAQGGNMQGALLHDANDAKEQLSYTRYPSAGSNPIGLGDALARCAHKFFLQRIVSQPSDEAVRTSSGGYRTLYRLCQGQHVDTQGEILNDTWLVMSPDAIHWDFDRWDGSYRDDSDQLELFRLPSDYEATSVQQVMADFADDFDEKERVKMPVHLEPYFSFCRYGVWNLLADAEKVQLAKSKQMLKTLQNANPLPNVPQR